MSSSSEKLKSVDSTITQQPINELTKLDVEPITIDDEQIKPVETDQEPTQQYAEQVNTNPQPIEPDIISATKSVKEETASFFTKDPDGKTIKFVQNELVDYRVSITELFFVDNIVQYSCLQTSCTGHGSNLYWAYLRLCYKRNNRKY